MGAIREVRKRDDRVVPFDETKIADAIYKAIRSVGRGDRSLAQELAQAVTHFLEKKFSGSIPGIEDIQDQVETVLIETGHSEIAKAYILYRNKRSTVREALRVRKEGDGGAGAGPELVEDRGGVAEWSKGKIVAALIREADLEAGIAEEIASAVERKVFGSGMQRISVALIRELVDNELFERGFSAKLRRQAPLGLPKYNLEQILFSTDTKEGFTFPKTPPEVRDFIASEILQQYALQEVFSPAVADAHREGRIHLHGLGDPLLFERLIGDGGGAAAAVSNFGLHAKGEAGRDRGGSEDVSSRSDLAELFQRLSDLAPFAALEIRLKRPYGLLSAARRSPEEELAEIDLVYSRLMDARAGMPATHTKAGLQPRRGGAALELEIDAGSAPWLRVLSERAPIARPAVYLRLKRGDLRHPELRRALELAAALFERGEPIEFLPPARPDHGWGHGGLLAVAPEVTVNMPRAVYRSASDRSGDVHRQLEDVLDVAIKAHLERRRFLERLGANRENPLWDLLGRPADGRGRPQVTLAEAEFPIGVLGLNECVKFLTGCELHQDPRALRAARSLIESIAVKLARESRGLGLRLYLKESRNAGPLRRFEEIDRQFPESKEIDRGRESSEGGSYTDGVRMHRRAPIDPLSRIQHLASFLDFVSPLGLIEDSPELRGGGAELIQSLLEESLPCLTEAAPRKGRTGLQTVDPVKERG